MTGLAGGFDFRCELPGRIEPEDGSPIAFRRAISLATFDALPEQLGLKVEPRTAPVDV